MADTTDITDTTAARTKPAPWRGPAGLRALRNRDYALFWGGLVVSATGSWMQNVAQGWLVFDLTHSQLYLGIVSAASTLPVLILTLPGGVMADRLSKRTIVTATQTAAMVLAFVVAALTYSGLIRAWHIVALSVCSGIVNALDVPARQSMVMELVGEEDILNAVALNSTAFNAARIVGPATAGIMVAAGGAGLCFLINGISHIGVIAALISIQAARFRTGSPGKSVTFEIREGMRYARKNPLIRDILIVTGAMSVFVLQYSSQMPAFAKGVLRTGPEGLGVLVSAAGVGAISAALAIAALGHLFKERTIMAVGGLLVPMGVLLLSAVHSLLLSAACLVVVGFGTIMFLAVSNSVVQMESPDQMRGRMMSLRTLVFLGLTPLGALLIGAMAQYWGVQAALRFGAAACGIVTLMFSIRQNRSPKSSSPA